MCRWSRRRKAYSGVRSSCPNGILLTLVTSGAKYRLGSNRAVFDSQDRMCRSTDRQMDVVPLQMLLLGQGLGFFAQRCYPHGNPAASHPGLWMHSQGEKWVWFGHGSPAVSPTSVVLCPFVPDKSLIPGVTVKAARNICASDILPQPSLFLPHSFPVAFSYVNSQSCTFQDKICISSSILQKPFSNLDQKKDGPHLSHLCLQ